MNKILLLLLAVFVSRGTFAQQSALSLPRDSRANPLSAGLGLPYLYELTSITNTTYDVSHRVTLSVAGPDYQRQWRHMQMFNLSAARSVYICAGDSTGCSRDMWKANAATAIVDDYAFFGPGNNITHLYYRIDSSGTANLDLRIW